jgi:hypothetical protein
MSDMTIQRSASHTTDALPYLKTLSLIMGLLMVWVGLCAI